MLIHGGLNAVERVIQRPCSLLLRYRLIPVAILARRNAETGNKEVRSVGRDRSILEKVLIKEQKSKSLKVKEKATNVYLYVVYAVSVFVMGSMAYLLYEAVFAPGAPQTVFGKALSLIKNNPECQKLLGDSIVGYAEGRGRIKHIIHHNYKKDGHDRIRVQFSVKGTENEGTTTAEMEKIDGRWEWRFLIVSVTGLVPKTVVLIDNR